MQLRYYCTTRVFCCHLNTLLIVWFLSVIKVGRIYPFSHVEVCYIYKNLLNFSCRFSLLGEKFLLAVRQNDYESENNVSCSTPPAAARGNLFPEAPWLEQEQMQNHREACSA